MLKEYDCFTEEECKGLSRLIKQNQENWSKRNEGFYTLGVASYLDRENYQQKSRSSNEFLLTSTDIHTNPIMDKFYGIVAKEVFGECVIREDCALPGFHIFNKNSNGMNASFHIDRPFDRLTYIGNYKNPQSFTVLLEEPKIGAGLHWWDNNTFDPKQYDDDNTPPNSNLEMYKIGKLYLHDGSTYHQMANLGNIEEGEFRITLQGHTVDLDNNWTILYF